MDLLCTHCGAVVLAHRPERPSGEEITAAIAAHEATCRALSAQRRSEPAPQRTS